MGRGFVAAMEENGRAFSADPSKPNKWGQSGEPKAASLYIVGATWAKAGCPWDIYAYGPNYPLHVCLLKSLSISKRSSEEK